MQVQISNDRELIIAMLLMMGLASTLMKGVIVYSAW